MKKWSAKEKIIYTIKHRKAIRNIYFSLPKNKRLCNKFRIYTHDLDKLFLYIFAKIFMIDYKTIQLFHRKNRKHHDECLKHKSEADYFEMILDWESARFTKPDKPLNARETLDKYYPHLISDILPILDKIGL